MLNSRPDPDKDGFGSRTSRLFGGRKNINKNMNIAA
jgi:hypothetical protein